MRFRDSASFGKRQEFIAIAELLRRGCDVYLTLVDDQQIDCVMRKEHRGRPIYIDLQIKARSTQVSPRNFGRFAAMEIPKPRRNLFFIFYSERAACYWIMPSLHVVKKANRVKSGKYKNCYSIVLTNVSRRTGAATPRPRFREYENNFDLLRKFRG